MIISVPIVKGCHGAKLTIILCDNSVVCMCFANSTISKVFLLISHLLMTQYPTGETKNLPPVAY